MTIDELIVRLVLDASAFAQGQKDAAAAAQRGATDLKAAAEAGERAQTSAFRNLVVVINQFAAAQEKGADRGERAAKRQVDGNSKVAASFDVLIRRGLTFVAVLAGAKGVEEFTRRITVLDAALGRTSQGMGQAPETLSAIGKAAERMGGTFDGAVGGLRNLSDQFQQLRTTGTNAIMEPLARLQALSGKSITFGKDVRENFLSIADAVQALGKRDPAQADFLARQITGDEGLAVLMRGGRRGVLAAEAESRRHGVINPEDTAAAQRLQESFTGLSQTVVDLGTKIETKLSPYVSGLLERLNGWIDKNKDLIATDVLKWVTGIGDWLSTHQGDVEKFGKAMGDLATAAGTVATAFASQSPLVMALEAAVLLGGRLTGAFGLLRLAMVGLAAVPAPAWLLAIAGVSAAGTWQSAQRSAQDFSDPKSADDPSIGVNPETGLTTHVDKPSEEAQHRLDGASAGGVWGWIKRLYGFGGSGDTKAKDDIGDTAKATKGIFDLMRNGVNGVAGALGFGGVTASSGGLGGSGHHADGSSPGASLRDRQFHGKGNFGQKGWWTPERQGHAIDVLMKEAGLTEAGAKALVSRWMYVESPGGPTAVNPKSGAEGIAQWLGGRKGDGSSGSFDDQLKKAARELNGKEGRAKKMLNTPGREAAGASQFERAEGYNAATGEDNFTARTAEGMKHVVHGAGTATPEAPAAPPTAAMSDAEAKQAQAWVDSLGRDHPLTQAEHDKLGPLQKRLDAYYASRPAPGPMVRPNVSGPDPKPGPEVSPEGRRQKDLGPATPKHGKPLPSWMAKDGTAEGISTTDFRDPKFAPAPTVGDAARHLLHFMHRAGRLGSHGGGPVPVTMDERGAKHINEALRRRAVGAGRAHYNHDIDRAMGHAAMDYHRSLMHGARYAALMRHGITNHVDRSVTSDSTINGGVHIHTQATDAKGIAAEFEPMLQRGLRAQNVNYGLA